MQVIARIELRADAFGIRRVACGCFEIHHRVEITSLPSGTTVDVENISGRHEVVIVGVGDPWDSALLDRVSRLSQPTLFGVRTDGRESWLYRMRLCPEPLGPMSPRQIRTAVLAGQDPSA